MRISFIVISLVTLLSSLGPSRAAIMQSWCWDGTAQMHLANWNAPSSHTNSVWPTSRASVTAWQIRKSIRFRRFREDT